MWLTNLQIVLPDRTLTRGAIHIAGEQIDVIQSGAVLPRQSEPVVDGRGLIAMPGIIDMHGDMIEGELEPRPGAHFPLDMAVFELDKRLASNGITTAYAAISFWETVRRGKQRSGERAQHIVDAIHTLRDQLLIDLFVHARFEVTMPSIAPVLSILIEANQVHLLSLMDHTPGQGQYRDLEHYVNSIASLRQLPPDQIAADVLKRSQNQLDTAALWQTSNELVTLAKNHGIPLASHDDDTLEKINLMIGLGVAISEFPVTLAAATAARQQGIAVAMGAPNVLRGVSHTGNLSATDAIRAGVVDILAADYAPAALLQAIFVLAEQQILPLHEASKLISQNPATALGLRDRGRLEVGLTADIVLVEPATRPRVRGTIRRGVPIYWDASMAQRSA